MNKKALVAGVRDGVQEIYSGGETSLTEGEQAAIGNAAGVAGAGVVCMGVAKTFAFAAGGMLCAKAMVVGGTAVAVGALGKCWVRGFMEGYQHEVRKAAL
jgi:hypothetical protein